MPNKKKLFNKDNSVKFLLLHGNTQAVNADGETLENVLVPVSKNYKPGTSLLMSNIGAITNAETPDVDEEEADLEKIMDEFGDSDTEVVVEELPSKLKHLNFSVVSKKPKPAGDYDKEDALDDDFFDGQFSDASNSSFEDFDEEEDDTINHPSCPATLKMFNAKFREVLKEYDDDQIGALDDEDICGYLTPSSDRFGNLDTSKEEVIVIGECDKDLKEKILNYAEDSGDEKIVEIVTEKPLEFDCESILSTYSNIYNHPAVIKEEKIKKIRIPNNPLKKRLTKSQLKTLPDENDDDEEDDSDDNVSVGTSFTVRVKGETPEQRRQRKKEFKEAKRECRILKKENKLAFKQAKKLQQSQHINAQRTAGIRLL